MASPLQLSVCSDSQSPAPPLQWMSAQLVGQQLALTCTRGYVYDSPGEQGTPGWSRAKPPAVKVIVGLVINDDHETS